MNDVYYLEAHKSHVFSFAEAAKFFWEIYHPTTYNRPKAILMANIELNMQVIYLFNTYCVDSSSFVSSGFFIVTSVFSAEK